MPLRLTAFVFALIAVFFLGRALYDLIQQGLLAWISIFIGGGAAIVAAMALRASRRP